MNDEEKTYKVKRLANGKYSFVDDKGQPGREFDKIVMEELLPDAEAELEEPEQKEERWLNFVCDEEKTKYYADLEERKRREEQEFEEQKRQERKERRKELDKWEAERKEKKRREELDRWQAERERHEAQREQIRKEWRMRQEWDKEDEKAMEPKLQRWCELWRQEPVYVLRRNEPNYLEQHKERLKNEWQENWELRGKWELMRELKMEFLAKWTDMERERQEEREQQTPDMEEEQMQKAWREHLKMEWQRGQEQERERQEEHERQKAWREERKLRGLAGVGICLLLFFVVLINGL